MTVNTAPIVTVSDFLTGVVPTSDTLVYPLQPGAYYVRWFKGTYFLEPTVAPVRPKNIYGTSVANRANRIFSDFMSTENTSIGALFVGQAGSGKTLMMQEIACMAIEQGLFVLILDAGFGGADFNSFIHDALGPIPAVILIDEIEKKYKMVGDEDDNESPQGLASLLELLQGVKTSKKLFLGTANSTSAISTYLINRPGRIKYMVQFNGLDHETIAMYISDHVPNQELAKALIQRMQCQQVVTFDILQAVCKEVVRMGSVDAALTDLNVVDTFGSATFTIMEVTDSTGMVHPHQDDIYYQPQRNERVRVQFSAAYLCAKIGIPESFFREQWSYEDYDNSAFAKKFKARNISMNFYPDPDSTLENVGGKIQVKLVCNVLRALRERFEDIGTEHSIGAVDRTTQMHITAEISRNRTFASAF